MQNFVPSNIRLLEQSWDRVKAVLLFSARLFRDLGLCGDRLSGTNVLMLVAYYIHRRNLGPTELKIDSEDSQLIRRWIIMLGFQGLPGLQTNNPFNTYRNAVRRAFKQEHGFPWEAVAEAFRGIGPPWSLTGNPWLVGAIPRWITSPSRDTSLPDIYGDDLPNLQRRAMPAVQNRFFLPKEMHRAGISEALAPVIQGFAGKLILSVALNTREQENYFAVFLEQRAPLPPCNMHCLPEDPVLYRMDRLPDWVSERRTLLGKQACRACFCQLVTAL